MMSVTPQNHLNRINLNTYAIIRPDLTRVEFLSHAYLKLL